MSYSIEAKTRESGTAEEVRGNDEVPAVVYGPEVDSTPISVDSIKFKKLYKKAGVSNLVDLELEDEEDPLVVLIQDLQYDPIKNTILHADFKQIPMGEEIDAEISLNFVGVAPGVKAHGGVLLKQLDSLEVRCLPKDLIDHIDVDVSVLEEIDDAIHVEDLEIPEGLEVQNPDDVLVAKVAEVTVEEFDEDEDEEEMSIEDVEVEGEVPEEELEEGEELPEEEKLEEGEEVPEEKSE